MIPPKVVPNGAQEGERNIMRAISTATAPTPAGHYSQAIVHGDTVFVSGQLPINAETGERVVGSIEEQTEQALRNLAEILRAANSGIDLVLKTTVYVSDIQLWDRVNRVYARFFGDHRPARAVVPTRELHFGFQIEIEALAAARK
jgi:2-iminobutanoate/2-iminopropanoate deaminase